MGDAEIFQVVDHHCEIVVVGPSEAGVGVDADGVDEAACGENGLI